jgi:hypothetical protein
VWSALFPVTTPVIGFEWRDLTNHSVLSFPAAEVDKLVQGLYGDLAAARALSPLPHAAYEAEDRQV